MNLPLPEQNDIYALGFDRSLNRDNAQEVNGGGTVYNLQNSIAGQTIDMGSNIGGWNVGPNAFSSGTGSLSVGFSTAITSGDDVRIYAGNDTINTAPFRVTESGVLYASAANITGTITASVGTIGGFTIGTDNIKDAADSMGLASTVTGGDDVRFWAGTTFAGRATAPFRVTEAGAVTGSSVTITGGAVTGTPIASIPNSTATDISLLDYTHDLVFSETDSDTVAWATGTITMSNGRTFSISAGNTGNMAAKTYIYLDTGASSTVLQTTTTVATAMGANKKLIAVAQNGTGAATWQVNEGIGGLKITAAMTSVANNDWSFSGAWSVTDADTIAWGAGTLTTSNGGSYSISGSNTGNMVAKTYIYFALGTSATAFQTTTTASTAIGEGKILIATAQNATGEAKFMVMNDNQYNIDAANIVAGSVTANEIAASTITGANILTMNISGKNATFDTGTIGGFTMAATTLSATNFTVTSGAANTANVTVGTGSTAGGINSANASGDIAFWAGSTFANRATAPFRVTAGGAVTATSATISGYVLSSKGVFGGDGSDGALSISSGTTSIDLANAKYLIKNYTSISITGTGKLAFTNPHDNGTVVILKSQGAVTLTSSTAPNIDCSGLGAKGGIGVNTTGAAVSGNTGYQGLMPGVGILSNPGTGGLVGPSEGVGGAQATVVHYELPTSAATIKYAYGFLGASGGTGGVSGATSAISADGGRGGGMLVMECAGALNFTSTNGISVAGVDAAAGSAAGGAGAAGSGGGAAGFFAGFYNTLTANSGTVNVSKGNGHAGSGTSINLAGGGGGNPVAAGTDGSGSTGGNGADGYSMGWLVNTEFA